MKRLIITLAVTSALAISPALAAETSECHALFKDNDHHKALQHCRKAAEAGDAEAAWLMGQMFSQGLGTHVDTQERFVWFRMAAESGHADSQYNLAVILDMGEGMAEDNRAAVEWYRKAAAQNHSQAQHNLALMYANGEGVGQDYEEALKWTHRAAENGLAESQFLLGQMYRTGGQLMPEDGERSLMWFTKAGRQGHLQSQLILALTYAQGTGVEVEPNLAMDWSRQAAFQGSPRAQFLLGILHVSFSEDQEDLQQATAWLTVAMASGFVDAIEPLKKVTGRLSHDEFVEAQKSAQAIIETVQRQQHGFQGI